MFKRPLKMQMLFSHVSLTLSNPTHSRHQNRPTAFSSDAGTTDALRVRKGRCCWVKCTFRVPTSTSTWSNQETYRGGKQREKQVGFLVFLGSFHGSRWFHRHVVFFFKMNMLYLVFFLFERLTLTRGSICWPISKAEGSLCANLRY